MTFQTDGFLSSALDHHFSTDPACAEWFNLAFELNRIGHARAILERDVRINDGQSKPLAWLCLFRAVSNFQGAVALADRGLIVEARALTRCLGETALSLVGLKFDDGHSDALFAAEIKSRKSRAKLMLKEPSWLDPEQIGILNQQLADLNKHDTTDPLSYEEIAKKAKVGIIYNLYRQLSADSAHVSLESLHRYIGKDEDGKIFLQPVPKLSSRGINYTMDCACSFFFLAVSVHSEIEPGQGGADRMGDLWKTYLALTNTLHEELDATENVPDALDM